MSDIRLFRLAKGKAAELQGEASDLEKPLQTLIERNLDRLLGVRFVASEYMTGGTHPGRIDTLGLDENNSPVIIEYKRSVGENVINQGLFYLDWLMDHRAEFEALVRRTLGTTAAASIDWNAPRTICIASNFTRYDAHAIQQMNRGIELLRYRRFGKDLFLLELVNLPGAQPARGRRTGRRPVGPAGGGGDKTVAEWLRTLPPAMRDLFESLDGYITSLGDDVQRKELRLYVAFKRIRNFASVVFQSNRLKLYLHLNPSTVHLEAGFSRDVRRKGHWGTGSLELSLKGPADLEKAKPLIRRAYEGGPDAR